VLRVGSPETASSTIAKQWKWLEDQRLVKRTGRRGRYSEVVLLREDGSGQPYSPTASGGRWIRIPFAYWTDNWYGRLDLPAKAVLLIGISLLDDFILPLEQAPKWYGISADTASRGLRTLGDAGLLTVRRLRKPSASAPNGFTVQSHYTLAGPFGPKGKRSGTLTRALEIDS
jgi:hypothetical protein